MSNRPCMCGDTYCNSCGNPGAAALEDAEQGVMDAFDEKKFNAEEYRIAMIVGIAAVEAHRKAVEVVVTEQLSGYAQYCGQLKDELELLKHPL